MFGNAQPRAVYAAISKVSAAMAKYGIGKEGRNTSQNFNFRGIDQVLDALSTPLVEAGLLILPRVMARTISERPTKAGGVQYDVVVTVAFDLVAVSDGSVHTVVMVGEAMDGTDKATSKAISMAYKYMAFDTFCIPVSGLEDADASTPLPTVSRAVTRTMEPANDAPEAPSSEPKSDADPYAATLAAVSAAPDHAALAALKVQVSKFAKHPEWKALKELYTARNTELKAA